VLIHVINLCAILLHKIFNKNVFVILYIFLVLIEVIRNKVHETAHDTHKYMDLYHKLVAGAKIYTIV